VPFAPESTLSGIGETDFLNTVWYRKTLEIPSHWQGKRILLHFQAVDYDATVWINGQMRTTHRGCFTPFTVDLGMISGSVTVVLQAKTLRDRNRPRGKQSDKPENYLCCYTRTSGIWQTVWMEAVPEVFCKKAKIVPTPEGFDITVPLSANRPGWRVNAQLRSGDRVVAAASGAADSALMIILHLTIPEGSRRYWSPEDPFLYDLTVTLINADGQTIDSIQSYAGWRFITIDGMKIKLNGKAVFQKLVLDQGYYPDGIWTAPSDEAMVKDIRLAMQAGFNGARLHQKVFEERFLYHADRLGYLVWGEFGDWGFDWNTEDQTPGGLYQPGLSMAGQWIEEIMRDWNHPAIIGWCALNETHKREINGQKTLDVIDDLVKATFLAAKAIDPTRPVLDTSGYIHRFEASDIYDNHDYGMPDEVKAHLQSYTPPCNCDPYPESPWNIHWQGQPFFISEIGGIAWPPEAVAKLTFSYGDPPQTEDEFFDRFTQLIRVIKADKRVFGYCYTQLTDVFQEINGLFYFDRTPKFSSAKLYAAQADTAEFEKE